MEGALCLSSTAGERGVLGMGHSLEVVDDLHQPKLGMSCNLGLAGRFHPSYANEAGVGCERAKPRMCMVDSNPTFWTLY